jgi:hypothetical protein
MSDRLQELLRQKALLDEHAAWFEREIALERARSGGNPPTAAPVAPAAAPAPVPATTPARATPAAAPAAMAPSVEAEAEAIIEQYRAPAQSSRQQLKWGCILYLIGALVLVALSVLAIYLLAGRR